MTDGWHIVKHIADDAVIGVELFHVCENDTQSLIDIKGMGIICAECSSVAPDSLVQEYRRTLENFGVEQ